MIPIYKKHCIIDILILSGQTMYKSFEKFLPLTKLMKQNNKFKDRSENILN